MRQNRAPTLESTASDLGTLWRSEIHDEYGRLADSTRWTRHPRQAIREGELLRLGVYWAGDDQPRYTTAA